jgi:hypothetical protein
MTVCTLPVPYEDFTAFVAAGGSASDNCGINEDSFELFSEVSDGNTNPETITRTYKIEDNCGNEARCQQVIIIEDVNVATWVYLEGSAINPGGSGIYTLPLRTDLFNLRILPGQTYQHFFLGIMQTAAGQPYNTPPWNYGGGEGASYNSYGEPEPGTANYPNSGTDWVLVSLRDAPDGATLCQKAAILHKTGLVEFVDGGFDCCNLNFESSYYLVIEHRNHLIIMSPEPLPILDGTLTFDFRANQSYIYDPFNFGAVGQKEVQAGVFVMYAANGDQVKTGIELDGDDVGINFNDRTYWEGQNGVVGRYRFADYNLNGDCNYNDRTTFEFNNGRFTSVPRN